MFPSRASAPPRGGLSRRARRHCRGGDGGGARLRQPSPLGGALRPLTLRAAVRGGPRGRCGRSPAPMSGAGPLRGFPFGPPPPSACFGPPAPCSRRGRAVLGFSGYALPLPRFGRLRHCPSPDPAAAQRPHCAKDRPPAAQRPHRVRPDPRGRCGWARRAERTAPTDRLPTATRGPRAYGPTDRLPTNEHRPRSERPTFAPDARSFLARCSLVPRSLRAARAAARSAARAPKGRRGAKPRTLPRGSWGARPARKGGTKKPT